MLYVAAGGDRPAALTQLEALPHYASVRFGALLNAVREELLTLGMNPGGPQRSQRNTACDDAAVEGSRPCGSMN